jgi:exodeoxyribonuclease VII large subunit
MTVNLLDSLFDDQKARPLSVSELTAEVKIELERRFASVWVEGEIVNFIEANSGHWYFNLNDGFSQIKAVCFRGTNFRIRFKPANGQSVRVRGRISVFEKRGEYQLLADSLEPAGEGALKAAYEQIKIRLESEGLFAQERKRALPFFPKRVGVITSPSGAVIHDIMNVLTRRTRSVSVVLVPVRVQGETAGEEVAAAIKLTNKFNEKTIEKNGIDVLIVARGGGSAEDLWAFNEESVARAIYGSKIPVISAIGHETDVTIADLVADLRAPTPSAAAELVAVHEAELANYISDQERTLSKLLSWKLLEAKNDVQALRLAPVFARFPQKIKDLNRSLGDFQARGEKLLRDRWAKADERLKVGMASLDALSPLGVLRRGYSITYKENGRVLTKAADALKAEKIKVQLARGSVEAWIERISEE